MTVSEQRDAGQSTNRFYDSYVSTTEAGNSNTEANTFTYRRQIRPYLPEGPAQLRILDIGCGQGHLVQIMLTDGLDAYGVDISPEQVALARSRGLDRVELGDFRSWLATEHAWDAVIATDILEHLGKDDVMRTFDQVARALKPGGVFVARVPNAVSPTGGNIMYGDITHQTWFTQRSLAQLAAVAGFESVRFAACTPPVHGFRSLLRAGVWRAFSAVWKASLVAETGRVRGHIVTQNLVCVAQASRSPGERLT
ncbi:class I SAM-dependent methyltransferase [Micromonospora sp. WMMD882]|uniref:class I SAM-dependent DNA methyltransferase n=1 Tax=Micromonospora sp. WMMD882 TaxID=3015151 RepID=UPI00248C17D0|nr:class I SAM-dependent methyltransferase [Micromonospora sp. WMMD882]WBB81191.1 class I SAM-dependent methyltransferase [Micromonospora sp. WMMD882]